MLRGLADTAHSRRHSGRYGEHRAGFSAVLVNMSQLLACPFCRELFDRAEAEQCPECDIPLEPLHRLPPSPEAALEEALLWERNRPEDERLPWLDLGRGRGALLALAVVSLGLFALAPWVNVSAPYTEARSGLSLARGQLGFLWGGAVGWFVSIALVVSRRTIAEMRGVRAILMAFTAMTASEIGVLLVMSPRASHQVHVVYAWSWGLYAALAASLLGIACAARFGGPRPASPEPPSPDAPVPATTTDPPHTVH